MFDDKKYPYENNVYGALRSASEVGAVAEVFGSSGWSVRKSSFHEYEVERTWADLNLAGSGSVHFSGVVAPEFMSEFTRFLQSAFGDYQVELYDQDGALIGTYASK